MNNQQSFQGIAAAPGMTLGPALHYRRQEFAVPRYQAAEPEAEWQRLSSAIEQAAREVESIYEEIKSRGKADDAEVFQAHLMFLKDRALLKRVRKDLDQGANAEAAWKDGIDFYARQLAALSDPVLSAREADVRDVGLRVLGILSGRGERFFSLADEVIIVADDLLPSETASLDKAKVLGFCLAGGGASSHTAILARGLGIPAVAGLGNGFLAVEDGTVLIVDGEQGQVFTNPDNDQVQSTRQRMAARAARQEQWIAISQGAVSTLDGVPKEVVANIGSAADASLAVKFGADGVGLFRTEFLYLNRSSMPPEAEQVATYRQVFEVMSGKPVVVRTLDIGGDKAVTYLGITGEANPFLGWRAIRMIDERPDVLATQLRALLLAGVNADLRIMLPMVSSLGEVLQVRAILNDVLDELDRAGLQRAQKFQFGIMIEVPAAALMAEKIAPHVDFFSIGTNDLTQYTLAVDRGNPRVAHLASPYHPAVLRLIDHTIRSAHAAGKWVGLCGEFAGDALAVPVLLGLGLDEFSMAPARILEVKQTIRAWRMEESLPIARAALEMSTAEEVIAYLEGNKKEL